MKINFGKWQILSLFLIMALSSCSSSQLRSPNEQGGLEGNAANDTVVDDDDGYLYELFDYIIDNLYFSYETVIDSSSSSEQFTQTFTPYAWYVDAENEEESFGYAMSPSDDYAMFKYYLSDDGKTVYPSIYEYGGYSTLEKIVSIYSSIALAHPYMFEDTLDTLSYVKTGPNSYLLTDTETMSVFQYMTTVGSSITGYMNSITIQIVNEEEFIFDVEIDLGQYGEIVSRYTPLKTTKIDFVNELLVNGKLKGVDYFDDVNTFFAASKNNNYTLSGPTGEYTAVAPYTIYCTNDYFYLEYAEEYSSYDNYGYTFVKKGNTINVRNYDENGEWDGTTTPYTLNYDACFEFKKDENGDLYYALFVGPIENEDVSYLEVETLPEIGEENILYIVEEDDKKVVYEWKEQSDGSYVFSLYSSWYTTVGDFYINTGAATFYLDSMGLCDYAYMLYEKEDYSSEDEHSYVSHDSDVISGLANGLFGWGFQTSTTWMDYIVDSKLKVNLDGGNNLVSAKIGLTITHDGIDEYLYYSMSDFGTTSNSDVESFLAQK